VKFVRWVAGLLVAVVLIAFAVNNREPLSLNFDPLPWSLEVPAFAATLGALLVGFLAGLAFEWLRGLRARGLARSRARRIAALEAEVAALRQRQAEARAPAPPLAAPPPRDL
jgi:uncharacterized integral membrane protein